MVAVVTSAISDVARKRAAAQARRREADLAAEMAACCWRARADDGLAQAAGIADARLPIGVIERGAVARPASHALPLWTGGAVIGTLLPADSG